MVVHVESSVQNSKIRLGVTCTGLYLSDNQIVDVSPLQSLTGLQWLGLISNQIVDGLQVLEDLKKGGCIVFRWAVDEFGRA
eukprot:COSAG02_NODE_18726_length_922_cov_5.517618_2_plen_81_part_00